RIRFLFRGDWWIAKESAVILLHSIFFLSAVILVKKRVVRPAKLIHSFAKSINWIPVFTRMTENGRAGERENAGEGVAAVCVGRRLRLFQPTVSGGGRITNNIKRHCYSY